MSYEEEYKQAVLDLNIAEGKRDILRAEKKKLEEKLEEVNKDLTELVGGAWSGRGQIGRLRCQVKELEVKLQHSKMPKVIWQNTPTGWMAEYVVHKVTKKRVYVGSPGGRSCIYDKEGKPVPSGLGNFINIQATFGGPCPETLK